MLKRIIFDIDNTLIRWQDKYCQALSDTVDYFNLGIDYKIIDNVLGEQEKICEILSKERLLSDINKASNLNLNMNFIDEFFRRQTKMAELDEEELIETIEYLSNKYELVVLSNWFKEVQQGRLETIGIAKYFSHVYGGEEGRIKPHKDAFIRACGPYSPKECIMIGDSYEFDIIGAKNVGIPVIQVDLVNQIDTEKEYKIIKKISELKEML